jgi:FkbM family methyltransferase
VAVLRFLRKYSYYLLSLFELFFGFANPILLIKIFLNQAQPGQIVRLRRHGLQFKVRGALDVWSVKETFLDRFYEKYGYTIQPAWKIIDIGAGVGDYSLFAAAQPENQVFAFEPYPESFKLLQDNLRLNIMKNIQIFDLAVGAASGALILDLSSGEPLQFQSHLEQVADGKKSLAVKSLSLEDALSKLGLEACDLLKMDCEGAEYAILFNTPQAVLDRVHRIVMEYHDNLTEHTHAHLARFLSERGFMVETFSNPVHSHLGYLRASRKN